jgi:hypothetical protein
LQLGTRRARTTLISLITMTPNHWNSKPKIHSTNPPSLMTNGNAPLQRLHYLKRTDDGRLSTNQVYIRLHRSLLQGHTTPGLMSRKLECCRMLEIGSTCTSRSISTTLPYETALDQSVSIGFDFDISIGYENRDVQTIQHASFASPKTSSFKTTIE